MSDVATTATKAPRVAQANHELICEPNGPHTSIEVATGIRYTDIKSGMKMEFFPEGAKAGTALTMLALFGAKTKATNEASRIRNGEGGESKEQMEAVDEMFEALAQSPPVWREKAEGGSGSRTDKNLLAKVVVELMGKGDVADYLAKMEDTTPTGKDGKSTKGRDYVRAILATEAGPAYKIAAGKPQVSLASIA